MNSPRNLLTLLLLAAAAASAPAHALTRAQVEAQLAAAQRNGTVVGKLGVTDRQLRPWLYPPAAGAGQTRAVAAGPSSWRAGALTRADWNTNTYVPHAGRSVALQFKRSGTSTYSTVKTVTTASIPGSTVK